MKVVLLVALIASSAVGCMSDRSGLASESFVPRPGVTTRREAVRQLGNPDVVLGDVWIWRTCRVSGGKLKASYMMVGATVRNQSRTTLERRLRFDRNGRLLSAECVDYTPERNDWSINPWN